MLTCYLLLAAGEWLFSDRDEPRAVFTSWWRAHAMASIGNQIAGVHAYLVESMKFCPTYSLEL